MFYLGKLHKRLEAMTSGRSKTIAHDSRWVDSNSLQFHLTVGVTMVAIVGLGGVVTWTGWQTQRILIASHKQGVVTTAKRLQEDINLYQETMPGTAALERAVRNRSTPTLLIWVSSDQGKVLAKSPTLETPQWQQLGGAGRLQTLTNLSLIPQVRQVEDHFLVLCSGPLRIDGSQPGEIYVAADITQDQRMFIAILRSLAIVSTVTLLMMAVAIALYVQRSLRPLRQINQAAGSVSAEDLDQAQVHLEQAPSEVRELAQNFDRMLERLAQSWEQQRQFVSNVSHELRTPLTVVQGYLQSLLRRGSNLTPPQREALETATAEASRTIQLLQDLLYLARADSGFLVSQRQPLVLNDLLVEVAGMAEQFGDPALKLALPASVVEVCSDRNHLIQILLNLINNAVKYSPPGETITISLEKLDHRARIQVSDRGVGIPVQHQAQIFERFYRVDAARAPGGSGLGLAIVKTLVEGVGGSITVRSKPEAGSTFTVTLPIEPLSL